MASQRLHLWSVIMFRLPLKLKYQRRNGELHSKADACTLPM